MNSPSPDLLCEESIHVPETPVKRKPRVRDTITSVDSVATINDIRDQEVIEESAAALSVMFTDIVYIMRKFDISMPGSKIVLYLPAEVDIGWLDSTIWFTPWNVDLSKTVFLVIHEHSIRISIFGQEFAHYVLYKPFHTALLKLMRSGPYKLTAHNVHRTHTYAPKSPLDEYY